MLICRTCVRVDGAVMDAESAYRSFARIEGRLTNEERHGKARALANAELANRLQRSHRKVCPARNAPKAAH